MVEALCHRLTGWKVAGPNPDMIIDFFNFPKICSLIMALETTQPFTKMKSKTSWGKRAVGA
jgi:hypothetical protein